MTRRRPRIFSAITRGDYESSMAVIVVDSPFYLNDLSMELHYIAYWSSCLSVLLSPLPMS